MRHIFILLGFLLMVGSSFAQTSEDVTVELSATTQVTPPKITLKWKKVSYGSPTYLVHRKAKTATTWGAPIATLTATDSTYDDLSVIVDSAYEYQVSAPGSSYIGYGYVYAGIKAPAIHNRGAVLLLIDSTFSDSCATGITRLMNDLSGDGWQVIRHDFARTRPDTYIKSVIANDYATHANVKSVFLVGHLAVPYSGDLNPDGHTDHKGAWAADVYYSCPTGWTDVSVNNTSSTFTFTRNIPGDGKWDQTNLPVTPVLQVGRIDFYDMPAFAATEIQLMRRYLDKDHIYKMDSLNVIRRAVISDNFGYMSGEAFAGNGWRNFAPLVGRDSIRVLSANTIIPTLAASSYQWAYGCGGGSFSSAGGIGTTANFAATPDNGIFHMIFGSYFGDWNVQNNFLRAPLCANPPALTNCWAGRPAWFFHHMALGDHIGYSAVLTQNNTSLYRQSTAFHPSYPAGIGAGWVHVGLLGDPSLRTDYIKPITNLNVTTPYHAGAILTWTASPDPGVIGYYVYRTDSAYGYFQRLNATMITATTYTDLLATSGLKYYMVRPVKLQSTPSGAYYNLGLGVTDTGTITFSVLQVADAKPRVDVTLSPNPAQDYLNVKVNSAGACVATMYVVNAVGQRFDVVTKDLNVGDNSYMLNITGKAPGIYTLVVESGTTRVAQKWVKL